MAREHARVKLSIWDDDDFRLLSPAAQHLYLVLMIHPKLDYCGVTDWRPSRIAPFAGGWSAEAVEIAAQELSEAHYIIIDTESEEVLLRSFIRNDEFMDQPNMAVAMAKAHRSISSAAIRGIVVHELVRLHKDKPDLKGWAKVSDMLDKPSYDPSDYPSFKASDYPSDNPWIQPSPNPSLADQPNPSDKPSVQPSPTTAPNSLLPTPSSQLPKNEDQDLGVKRPETPPAPAEAKPPPTTKPHDRYRCTAHQGVAEPPPCNGCKSARERTDAETQSAEDRERDRRQRELEAARNACTACDGTWLTDTDGKPTGKRCTHPKARKSA